MLVLWRALTKYNCTKWTTTTSTSQFLSLLQDKNNSSACNDNPTDLEWIWNWSFIGQQPYQAKDHWWLIKSSNDSYFDALITCKMHYYFSSTYTFFDLDFIDFCNVMLVLCVYFRYLLIKSLCVSKWWNSVKKEKKGKKRKNKVKKSEVSGKQKPDQFFTHVSEAVCPLPAFSPLPWTWSEALLDDFCL